MKIKGKVKIEDETGESEDRRYRGIKRGHKSVEIEGREGIDRGQTRGDKGERRIHCRRDRRGWK